MLTNFHYLDCRNLGLLSLPGTVEILVDFSLPRTVVRFYKFTLPGTVVILAYVHYSGPVEMLLIFPFLEYLVYRLFC